MHRHHQDIAFCAYCGGRLGGANGHGPMVCDDCSRPAYLDPKLAAACIIAIDGRILLARRAIEPAIGKWSFPSGYVNRGENVEQAALREVREETRLEARINWLVGVYSRADHPVVLMVYDATSRGGTPVAGDETTEVGLFDPERLPELAFPRDELILNDWRSERRRRGLITL